MTVRSNWKRFWLRCTSPRVVEQRSLSSVQPATTMLPSRHQVASALRQSARGGALHECHGGGVAPVSREARLKKSARAGDVGKRNAERCLPSGHTAVVGRKELQPINSNGRRVAP